MTAVVHAFPEDAAPAGRFARALGVPLRLVEVHEFPDGETLVTVPETAATVLVYRSLHRPNPKVFPLLQACDAWRRRNVQRLVLVAPYLSYLRQDAVFAPGQALSRDVMGKLLGERFERIVTVDPHLHRTQDLAAVFPGAKVTVLSAARELASALSRSDDTVVVGPDVESGPWAAALATQLQAPHATLRKQRTGDARVELSRPDADMVRNRRVVLVDDICSSGATLELALRLLREAGAARIDIAVSHALFTSETEARLRGAGATRIVSTDSCEHPTNAAGLARLLAAAADDERPRRRGRRGLTGAALGAALVLGACATRVAETPPPSDSVGRAFEQPFRDLSLIREVAPDILVRSVAEPYRAAADCPSLDEELLALDRALGPDLDEPQAKVGDGLAMDFIGGALGLPYGGIIRRVTGAHGRERAYRAAVLSGMVRRGFLKGSRRGLGCPAPVVPVASKDQKP